MAPNQTPEKSKSNETERPFAVHRALHLLLDGLRLSHPEKSRETKLLQDELDEAYAKSIEEENARRAETALPPSNPEK